MMPTNNSSKGLVLALALLATAAATTRAEVRLETRSGVEPEVSVIVTPSGPWSPTSVVTSVVLNPDGDLIGDTPPGWNSRGAKALAAWSRPTEGAIELAIGQEDQWTPLTALTAPNTFRQPMVDALAMTWTVTWQQDEAGRPSVWVASVSDDGHVGEPRFVSDGVLVGTVPGLMSLHVLVHHPATGILEWIEVDISYVPTQPIPIELRPGGGIQVGDAGRNSLLGSCSACAELRLQEAQRTSGPTTILSWWSNASTLNTVEMGARGPVFPVRVSVSRTSAVHPPRLLEDAVRAILKH